MKKYLLYIGAFAIVFGGLLIGSWAHALKVSPTIYELSATPGQTIVKAVRLVNESTEVQTLQPSTQNFIADPEGKAPYYIGNQPESSLANWISVQTSKVTIEPGKSVDVPFTITVPANAEPGGHYAAIFWSEVPTSPQPKETIGIQSQIAAPIILLNVAGEVVEEGRLQSFGLTSADSKFQRLPIEFTATLSNSGNVHFRPKGQVTIKNMFGRVVAVLPFNAGKDGGNVLPNSVREFSVTWDRGFAFGMYTAALNVNYGSAGKTIENTDAVTFWVMSPVHVVIWFLVIVLLLGIIVLLFRRSLTPIGAVASKKTKPRS